MPAIIPELMVKDIQTSVDFYKDVLGFSVNELNPNPREPVFAELAFEDSILKLYQETEWKKEFPKFAKSTIGGTIQLRIMVKDIIKLFGKLKPYICQELHQTDYDTHEFSILDPDKYLLVFVQNRE
jgi:catechol 2,3-dioxygenase-like lactoylglutathione lyase family enzyme